MDVILILINFAASGLIGWTCICRLNALGPDSDWRVRAQFTLLFVGSTANGLSFLLWGDYPTLGSTLLSTSFLGGMLLSRHRWLRGAPPDTSSKRRKAA